MKHALVDERPARDGAAGDSAVLQFDSEEPEARSQGKPAPVALREDDGRRVPLRPDIAVGMLDLHSHARPAAVPTRQAMPIHVEARGGARMGRGFVLVACLAMAFVGGFLLGQRRPLTPRSEAAVSPVVVALPPLERLTADAGVLGMPALEGVPIGAEAPMAPDIGQLVVRSMPAGAEVTLDGVVRGTTPLALGRLRLGPRVLQLAFGGYDMRQRLIVLTPERPSRVVDLEMIRAGSMPPQQYTGEPTTVTGSVQVASSPAGASLFVDDRLVGTVPLLLSGIAPGSHRVRLELEGFEIWSTSVLIEPDQRFQIDATMAQVALAP